MELPETGCRVCGIYFMNLQANCAGLGSGIDSVLLHHKKLWRSVAGLASGNMWKHTAQPGMWYAEVKRQ